MLKVDHHKKIVYEGYGVDMDKVPSRCREIMLESLAPLAEGGYRYLHLAEWVLFDEVTQTIAEGLSYRSKNDALHAQLEQPDRVVRRVVEVLNYL